MLQQKIKLSYKITFSTLRECSILKYKKLRRLLVKKEKKISVPFVMSGWDKENGLF